MCATGDDRRFDREIGGRRGVFYIDAGFVRTGDSAACGDDRLAGTVVPGVDAAGDTVDISGGDYTDPARNYAGITGCIDCQSVDAAAQVGTGRILIVD